MPIADSERIVDWVAPDFVEEERIALSLPEDASPQANHPLTISIDYTGAGSYGVMVPIEVIVQPAFGDGGPALGYVRKVYRRTAPAVYIMRAPSSGTYLVLVREMFHNQFWGQLLVDVTGDQVMSVPLVRR